MLVEESESLEEIREVSSASGQEFDKTETMEIGGTQSSRSSSSISQLTKYPNTSENIASHSSDLYTNNMLTLDHFNQIAANNPGASIAVEGDDSSGYALQAKPHTSEASHEITQLTPDEVAKNRKTIELFHDALKQELEPSVIEYAFAKAKLHKQVFATTNIDSHAIHPLDSQKITEVLYHAYDQYIRNESKTPGNFVSPIFSYLSTQFPLFNRPDAAIAPKETRDFWHTFTLNSGAAIKEDYRTRKFPYTLERIVNVGQALQRYTEKWQETQTMLQDSLFKGDPFSEHSSYWLKAMECLVVNKGEEAVVWKQAAEKFDEFLKFKKEARDEPIMGESLITYLLASAKAIALKATLMQELKAANSSEKNLLQHAIDKMTLAIGYIDKASTFCTLEGNAAGHYEAFSIGAQIMNSANARLLRGKWMGRQAEKDLDPKITQSISQAIVATGRAIYFSDQSASFYKNSDSQAGDEMSEAAIYVLESLEAMDLKLTWMKGLMAEQGGSETIALKEQAISKLNKAIDLYGEAAELRKNKNSDSKACHEISEAAKYVLESAKAMDLKLTWMKGLMAEQGGSETIALREQAISKLNKAIDLYGEAAELKQKKTTNLDGKTAYEVSNDAEDCLKSVNSIDLKITLLKRKQEAVPGSELALLVQSAIDALDTAVDSFDRANDINNKRSKKIKSEQPEDTSRRMSGRDPEDSARQQESWRLFALADSSFGLAKKLAQQIAEKTTSIDTK